VRFGETWPCYRPGSTVLAVPFALSSEDYRWDTPDVLPATNREPNGRTQTREDGGNRYRERERERKKREDPGKVELEQV